MHIQSYKCKCHYFFAMYCLCSEEHLRLKKGPLMMLWRNLVCLGLLAAFANLSTECSVFERSCTHAKFELVTCLANWLLLWRNVVVLQKKKHLNHVQRLCSRWIQTHFTKIKPTTWQLAIHKRHSLGMFSFSTASQIFQSFLALSTGSCFWDAGTSCTAAFQWALTATDSNEGHKNQRNRRQIIDKPNSSGKKVIDDSCSTWWQRIRTNTVSFVLFSICQKNKSQSPMAQKRPSMKTNLIAAESIANDPDDDGAADGGGW